MMLRFPDPAKLKTKKCVFEEAFAARDPGTLEQLKELSCRRKLIEEAINETSTITEVIAREMSGGLSTHFQQMLHRLDQYLPLLENFVHQVDRVSSHQKIIRWTSGLKIRWTSPLSSSSFFRLGGPKFFQVDNLLYELAMTHFLYAAILRERALEVLPTDLVQSATLFREAAGVYLHLAHEVLSPLQQSLPAERPPEVITSVCLVMSSICLADAQAVAARRAEEKGSTAGLLAKLHCGIVELLDEADGILYAGTEECNEISSRFVEFISSCKVLHLVQSQKYLAEDLKIAGQVGVAIGVLRCALTNAKKEMPREESWKSVFQEEIDGIVEKLRKLERENESVWREKIPSGDELPLCKGNKIVNVITFVPKSWERKLIFKI